MTTHSGRRPNILLIMADQLAAPALPVYGNRVVDAPNLEALAARSVVFDAAYCNSPICVPSRSSMMSGRMPTEIGVYDNAAELTASIPTLCHYLCAMGYRTILSGKMHFIGPDQMHGYEERLTTDIYPSDFSWIPNWANGPRDRPSGISMQGVIQAGPCVRSLQMDYDDEVEFHALRRIYDLARGGDERPFFLTVSFSHPHPPFTIHSNYWNRYEDREINDPTVAPIPVEERDAQSQWLHSSHLADRQIVTKEHTRAARRAYYGMISYIDDKIGRLIYALEEAGLSDDTIVIFCSDHGEMLGERGMWYKQTFYEWSVRVPLLMAWPDRLEPRRTAEVVSLVDLLPTLIDLASDGDPPEPADPLAGTSMRQLLLEGADSAWPDTVISEYTDMGVTAPCRMIRSGRYKYIYVHGHSPSLYDLEADPDELSNLHGRPEFAEVEDDLRGRLLEGWDPERVQAAVLASQRRRLFIKEATLRSGAYPNWSFQVNRDDPRRYVRGAGASNAKAAARFPFVPPLADD